MAEYSWQEEASRNTFRSWMVPTVLVGMDEWEAISVATDKFQKIEFGITINGIPVNADEFLDGVERNMRHAASARAAEIVRENEQLATLSETLAQVELAAREAVYRAVRGTPLEQYLEGD